ncbi:DUF2164 domain-containing protein [Candidatus Parcubacteria bacterium]|jgi:uncharacterized protein (DUF2164 family)|nr:DUF2164 domain-containing protein [Candidatus Parcubacteria bacterium]MBT3948693.1 DUF2164 domain-containing protein [Candidatus Parcubacteria bacterium]
MSKIKRSWDVLTKKERRAAIEKIITFFAEERDEEIGIIAAEQVLDFFLELTGGKIYNRAIDNAKDWLKIRLINLDIDAEELKK